MENDGEIHYSDAIILGLQFPEFKKFYLNWISEIEYLGVKAHYDPNVNFSIPKDVLDDTMNDIFDSDMSDYHVHLESSAKMGGADPLAYEGGKWQAGMYKFLGHYIWKEPEGSEYDISLAMKVQRLLAIIII